MPIVRTRLQWGRGEIPRKGGESFGPCGDHVGLQWGRGEIPRKGSRTKVRIRSDSCFNGAAVRYRGKEAL